MTSSNSSWVPMPSFVRKLYSHFPLYYYPSTSAAQVPPSLSPVLWITPPSAAAPSTTVLSSDVECLKWQAYLALRGTNNVLVRWDVHSAGGIDGRLPCLWVNEKDTDVGNRLSKGELLSARMIPGWADEAYGEHVWNSELEGYLNEETKDESRAWVSLLEGAVHAALQGKISSQPPESLLKSWLYSTPSHSIQLLAILTPPPPPATGLNTLLPPHGLKVPAAALRSRYTEAISALSERLGTDKWFLGSSEPTPLDALVFAYLHTALHPRGKGQEYARAEVTRHVNLVAWERKIRALVQGAFLPLHTEN